MEAVESVQSKMACSGDVSDEGDKTVIKTEDDEADEASSRGNRENRLTTIIDQLRCQTKVKENILTDDFSLTFININIIPFDYILRSCDTSQRWGLVGGPAGGRHLTNASSYASNMGNIQGTTRGPFHARNRTRSLCVGVR
ncbi:hypothetical protein K1T71_007663 [Dendrolimus kikuchii]|uniref:Uncharacterized protein n=1 Tax=Dendrolimus kikuchii TaxID=765133 RepID=A0ACC1CYB1_9NEOP|nr:hypothetical protein K1T71_007663 [Dendrolimus kikuchii]